MPACLLLDALAAQVELGAGQRDDMEGVHDRGGLRQLICRRGLVAAEPVHRHDLHLFAKRLALLRQPAAQGGCRTSGDQVEQPRTAGAIEHGSQVDDDGDVAL